MPKSHSFHGGGCGCTQGGTYGGSEASDNVTSGITDAQLAMPQDSGIGNGVTGGGGWFGPANPNIGGYRSAVPASSYAGGAKKAAPKKAKPATKKTKPASASKKTKPAAKKPAKAAATKAKPRKTK